MNIHISCFRAPVNIIILTHFRSDLFSMWLQAYQSFPSGSDSKGSTCNAGDQGSIPGLGGFTGEGNGLTPVFFSGEFHGQSSLECYSPWGHKESNMTEQVTLASDFKLDKHLKISNKENTLQMLSKNIKAEQKRLLIK